MDGADRLQMRAEWLHGALGEHGNPVFVSLAVPHDDLAIAEIEVFHPKAQAIHEAESGSVEQGAHHRKGWLQIFEKPRHLVASEDDGQFPRTLGPFKLAEIPEFDFEDVFVEEYDGVERLVLRGSCHFPFHGQVAQKGVHFGGAHIPGVPLSLKEDVSADPLQIGLFGAQAVVLDPEDFSNLIEELGRGLGRLRRLGGRMNSCGWWDVSFGHGELTKAN